MRRLRWAFWLGAAAILVAGYFLARSAGLLGQPSTLRVAAVPDGDQEIAWIHPATNFPTWERFVAGVKRVQKRWPAIQIDDSNAFPSQTATVPEVALSFPGCKGKLWIRWYKLTSDAGNEAWVKALARREPAPLALIGGGSSDRARDLARALAAQKDWHGQPPLLLLTTATADKVYLDQEFVGRPLLDIYPKRTLRFCFSNSQIAEGIWSFICSQPDLQPQGGPAPQLAALAAGATGNPLTSATVLAADWQPGPVHILEWADDPYSQDLSMRFRDVLTRPDSRYPTLPASSHTILYSVGGYAKPNAREAEWIRSLDMDLPFLEMPTRRLLVLPTVDRPARRILSGLTVTAPLAVRNFVAVTGDSISFNTIYRDRDVAWNIQNMPVPLILFCHQNPVDWEPAPNAASAPAVPESATDDELLNALIVRLLVEAIFGMPARDPDATPGVRILASSDDLLQRLKDRQPAFFTPEGNRREGKGEYIVCLRPVIAGAVVQPRATIEVWRSRIEPKGGLSWQHVKTLPITYDSAQGGQGNGF